MSIQIVKPTDIVFHPIEINPTILAVAPSFQEKFYRPQNYFIEKNQSTGDYHLLNGAPAQSLTSETPEYTIHAFVIVEKDNYLMLEIGDCNHHVIAKRALSVVAAGDIYSFNKNQKIFKITDQAGSYHISASDPLAAEKRESTKTAMKAFHFPMHLFVPFTFKGFLFQPALEKEVSKNTHTQKLKIF